MIDESHPVADATKTDSYFHDPPTRDALLAAGRTLFARRGYEGASIRAITAQAGANLGAVTYHFGSKQALYEAVLDQVLSPLERGIRAASESSHIPLERMEAVVRAFFRHFADDPEMPPLMLQQMAAGRVPPEPVVNAVRAITGTLAMIVGEGQSDLTMRGGDPLLLALSVISQPVYLNLVEKISSQILGVDSADPTIRQGVEDHAVEFVLAALARHDAEEIWK